MFSTGIFLKIKFSKFLQTHFSSPIPIRMKKKMPYRVQFAMDYKKMPFRSTNFLTLHGLLHTYKENLRAYCPFIHILCTDYFRHFLTLVCPSSRIQYGSDEGRHSIWDFVELRPKLGRWWGLQHLLLYAAVGRPEMVAGKSLLKYVLL